MPAAKTNSTPKQAFERLEARISPEHKELFRKAAAIQGQSLTNFIISCVVQTATRVVQDHETITLSERDRKRFVEAMLHPPKPTGVMRRAIQRHKLRVEESH